MSFTHFESDENSGFLRCDRPDVARRQLEMSIGLVVVLSLASFVVVAATSLTGRTGSSVPVAAVETPIRTGQIVHAQAHMVPMFRMQASQSRIGDGG